MSGNRAIYRANLVLRAAEKWRKEMVEHPREGDFTHAEFELLVAVDDYREETWREHVNGPNIDADVTP